jgi:hypothetical protein
VTPLVNARTAKDRLKIFDDFMIFKTNHFKSETEILVEDELEIQKKRFSEENIQQPRVNRALNTV